MALVKTNLTNIKCCIIGSCGVGKTSIIKKYLDKTIKNTETTLGAIFWTMTHNPINTTTGFKIDFWDTAGQERYNSLIPMYSRNSDIIIITFDIADTQSFFDLEKWLNTVSPYCNNSNFLLVGNKIDMELYRQVFESDVLNFIKKHKKYQMKYFETSAITGHNIPELFQYILSLGEKIITKNKLHHKIKKNNIYEANNEIKNETQSCCQIL